MARAAGVTLLLEYEQRLKELSRLRVRERTETESVVKPQNLVLAAAAWLRAKWIGRAPRDEVTFDRSPLIRREERWSFDLGPFLYGMTEMAFFDSRRILLPVLNDFSYSGGERIRRELEIHFLGRIAKYGALRAPSDGGTLFTSSPSVLNSTGGATRWSREVRQEFLSPFSYHPVVPQLLREASGPLRHGLLEGPGKDDKTILGDLPRELTLSGNGEKTQIHIPQLDSRVLPRLVPICAELPVDRRKVELQSPGLRSSLENLVYDWQVCERARREVLGLVVHTFRGMYRTHVELLPAVSVVVATRRPDFLARVLGTFKSQTYVDKELILVCHGFSREQALQRAASAGISAKVIEVGPQFNLGRCLNEGIKSGRGRVWMKMDDDDLYGPSYVKDSVNLLVSTRADLLARPLMVVHQGGNWFYDEDKVARTNVFVEDSDPSGHMCGATLTGWTDPTRFGWFDERLGRGVDSEFLQRAQRSGLRLVSVNVPGYACIRYPEPDHHTWKDWRAAGQVIHDAAAKLWLGKNDFQLEMPV